MPDSQPLDYETPKPGPVKINLKLALLLAIVVLAIFVTARLLWWG